MQLQSPPLNRLQSALPSGRAQRIVLWVGTVVVFAALTFSHFWFALLGASLDTTARVIVNVGAVAFATLIYFLLTSLFEQSDRDPLRTLWRALLLAAGLLFAMVLLRLFLGEGQMDGRTHLSDNLSTAITAATLAVLETLFAVVILHSLRPLVLFRRSRTTRRFWRAMLVFVGIAALSTAPLAANKPPSILTSILLLGAIFPMVYCAFRLSWIVPLTFRHKLITILFSGGLALLLGLVLFMRFAGLGSAAGMFASERMPAVHLFSRSLGELVTFVLVFGFLYGLTAVLSLLFHLPTTKAFAQQTGEIRAFKALAELSNDVLDRDRLVATISGAPVRTGIADFAWLAVVDSQSGSLVPQVVAASGIPKSVAKRLANVDTLVSDAAMNGEPLVLGTATADHRIQAKPGDNLGSLVVLPIIAGGESYGALFAAKSMTEGFEPEDVGALEGFAGQAALALSHAALFQDALEKERMARELALARQVQQRLFPQTLPEVPGGDIAVVVHPAQEIAGDYYDVMDLGEGRFGFLVADVAGKGAAAAFYMAELKGVFQSSAKSAPSPGAFLALANEALASSLGSRAFISAVYAILDTTTCTLTVARAGHCPVVMARNGSGPWLLRADGLGLGLDAGPLFRKTIHEQEIHLATGDVFALFTDGLVETRSESGEEYGYDRIADAIQSTKGDAAVEILTSLLVSQEAFSSHASIDDDLTIVILKWNGDSSETPSFDQEKPFTVRPAFA